MRKSLLITYFFPPKIGGIENYLFNICKRLPKDKIVVLTDDLESRNNFRVNLHSHPRKSASTDRSGMTQITTRMNAEVKSQNLRVYRTNFFSWKYFKPSWLSLTWKIWKIIKKEKIEILQFGHYAHYLLIGFLFKRLFRFPYLIYIHGVDLWIYQRDWLGRWLMKLNLKNADKIIANSYFMKEEILRIGIEEKKIVVVHPGVDYTKFQIPNTKYQIPVQDDIKRKKVIFSLGRLIRLKGYDLVIKALPEVIKKVPNLIYLIVGEGEAEGELRDLVKKLNLERYVIFVGAIKGPEEIRAPYYALANLFVGPSREIQYKNYKHIESFGTAYLEASAAGKPVIATKIGGIPEAVLDGQTGILIPPGNPKVLIQALVKLLTDQKLAEKMGREGRERVKREFDWKGQVGKIVKLLNG